MSQQRFYTFAEHLEQVGHSYTTQLHKRERIITFLPLQNWNQSRCLEWLEQIEAVYEYYCTLTHPSGGETCSANATPMKSLITKALTNERPCHLRVALTIVIMSQWGSQILDNVRQGMHPALFFVVSFRVATELVEYSSPRSANLALSTTSESSGHKLASKYWYDLACSALALDECSAVPRHAQTDSTPSPIAEHIYKWHLFTCLLCLSLKRLYSNMEDLIDGCVLPNLHRAYAMVNGEESDHNAAMHWLRDDSRSDQQGPLSECWTCVRKGEAIAPHISLGIEGEKRCDLFYTTKISEQSGFNQLLIPVPEVASRTYLHVWDRGPRDGGICYRKVGLPPDDEAGHLANALLYTCGTSYNHSNGRMVQPVPPRSIRQFMLDGSIVVYMMVSLPPQSPQPTRSVHHAGDASQEPTIPVCIQSVAV